MSVPGKFLSFQLFLFYFKESPQGSRQKRIFCGQADRKVDSPPYGQRFVNVFGVSKTQAFFGPKQCFKPFLLGQYFHTCLQSGPRGLTPDPPPLTVSLTVKYPCLFYEGTNI